MAKASTRLCFTIHEDVKFKRESMKFDYRYDFCNYLNLIYSGMEKGTKFGNPL